MAMFYHAEGCRCGHCHAPPPDGAYPEGPDYEPEDGPLHSDSPCAGPGGACGCYGEGYAAGKDKAHFEVRALAEAQPHGRGCDCGPCQTSRALIAALVREAAHAGLCGCGLTGGLSAAPTMLATAAPLLARETSRTLAAQTLAGRADNLEREALKS